MAAVNKIALNSPSRQNPSELETAIAGALFDLESNTQDLKATLRPLQFVSAREVRIAYPPSAFFWNCVVGVFLLGVVVVLKICGHCGLPSIRLSTTNLFKIYQPVEEKDTGITRKSNQETPSMSIPKDTRILICVPRWDLNRIDVLTFHLTIG